ncbi:MAG: RNA polymerase factor sigma-54 [Treponema sp.]|nr:RNA polymerase factor sigma-54 [Treponema sp.]
MNLQLSQKPEINLSAQLYQFIKLMEMPALELRAKISQELESNPALEVESDSIEIPIDDSQINDEDAYFENTSDPGFIHKNGDESSDQQQKFIEGVLTRSETLQEHLLWQIQLEPIAPNIRRLCEILIQNLDSNGFHITPVDTLLQGEAPNLVKMATKTVQVLDPVGTCVQDYRESLHVQLALLPDAPDHAIQALDYLELFNKGKFAEAARKLDCSVKDAESIFCYIKTLNPFPGQQFSIAETRFITPDAQVVRRDGEFRIILNNEEIPVLGLNPFFAKISKGKGDKKAKSFARANLREARWFIQSIQQRNQTLLRVTQAIVERQRAFFEKGPGNLVPLTQQALAAELDLHESTISRIANGKYLQTEWGLFGVKYFFTNAVNKNAPRQYSKESVKVMIREMIAKEERRFSDQEIADSLEKQGIILARRTVAKYRKELDVGSSYTR